ncbi:ribonuclease P protein subunit p14-like isoform X2 [Pomacea canaliculata]|nr:ribonuclease P protein subunit p14-like isoform X2 [Pomacea canaliculata]
MEESEPSQYLRCVRKGKAPYWYMQVTLLYESGEKETDVLQLKHIIMQALTEIFGQVGASDTIDVLKLSSGNALLRVPTRSFVKLWGALTLYGKYKGRLCAFRVHQVSPNLMGLACNSREFKIPGLYDGH